MDDQVHKQAPSGAPIRPDRVPETQPPPVPTLEDSDPVASTKFSRYRTQLSNHRTGLSEHRTSLSEYRTDLSTNRTEMSKRRTGMSFQRTRLSADRTLMSVIRTSLSLIGFGFTIFQFFRSLQDAGTLEASSSPRNFGLSLVGLGIALLIMGIIYHVQFMLGLRKTRSQMIGDSLIHGESHFPPSLTLVTALLLLVIGVVAVVSMLG